MVCRTYSKLIKQIQSYLLCPGFLVLISLIPSAVLAQETANKDQASPSIGIYHLPEYKGTDLPSPGTQISFKVQLFNTQDTNIELRMIANSDGKLIELVPEKAYLNKNDYPEYIINSFTPLVSLSYYFVADTGSGSAIRSDSYTIQRPCIPNTDSVSAELDDSIQDGSERLKELVYKNWAIEDELKAYDSARSLLEKIQTELNRLDGQ